MTTMSSIPSETTSATKTVVSEDDPALVSFSDGDPVEPPTEPLSAAVETTVIAPADVTETVKVIRTTVTTTTTQVVQDNAHPDDVHLVRAQETHTTVSVGDGAQPGQVGILLDTFMTACYLCVTTGYRCHHERRSNAYWR